MVIKKSKAVALERRGDLTSLFWMIGRYGPAAALALIAMLSVWAAFIIFRTTRRQRRKTTVGDVGLGHESDALNATTEEEEETQNIESDKSDAELPVARGVDSKHGTPDGEGPVKRRKRQSAAATDVSNAPRENNPEPRPCLPIKPCNALHGQNDNREDPSLDADKEGIRRCLNTETFQDTETLSRHTKTSLMESEVCSEQGEPQQRDGRPLVDAELNKEVPRDFGHVTLPEMRASEADSLGLKPQEVSITTHKWVSCEAALEDEIPTTRSDVDGEKEREPQDEKEPSPAYAEQYQPSATSQSSEQQHNEKEEDVADQSTLVYEEEGGTALVGEEDVDVIGLSRLTGVAGSPQPILLFQQQRGQQQYVQRDLDCGLSSRWVDHLDMARVEDNSTSDKVTQSGEALCTVSRSLLPSIKDELTGSKAAWLVGPPVNSGFSQKSDVMLHQLSEQVEASITSLILELDQQTESKDRSGERKGKKVETSCGESTETKKEADYKRTEINIMEATMDNNEWMTVGNAEASYQNLPWMTSCFPSPAKPLREADKPSAEHPACASEAGAASPPYVQETLCPLQDEDVDTHHKMVASIQPMPQNVSVSFSVHYVTSSPSQMVAVAGDGSELGSWRSYAPLQRAKDGLWTGSVTFPAESQVEWKFVLVEDGKVLRWEECGNRHLETGHGEEVHVKKGWGLL